MNSAAQIRYRFELPDGTARSFDFSFNPHDFRLINPPPAAAPFWSQLGFNQCENCPLSAALHPHCPVALQMAAAVEALQDLVSFDAVSVSVAQAERTIYAETTVQQAMSSVLGLVMATAGCPWTDRLRPMARFHLPFANEAETVYRSVSMFLLARELYFADESGGFDGLASLYESLHIVNRDMARRLGAATRSDPARNAIALLDAYTILLPAALEASLEELKPLFAAWAADGSKII
jgi:hypothetical protein